MERLDGAKHQAKGCLEVVCQPADAIGRFVEKIQDEYGTTDSCFLASAVSTVFAQVCGAKATAATGAMLSLVYYLGETDEEGEMKSLLDAAKKVYSYTEAQEISKVHGKVFKKDGFQRFEKIWNNWDKISEHSNGETLKNELELKTAVTRSISDSYHVSYVCVDESSAELYFLLLLQKACKITNLTIISKSPCTLLEEFARRNGIQNLLLAPLYKTRYRFFSCTRPARNSEPVDQANYLRFKYAKQKIERGETHLCGLETMNNDLIMEKQESNRKTLEVAFRYVSMLPVAILAVGTVSR